MDPLAYSVMGQLVVAESVRRQFEHVANGKVAPTRPARIVRGGRGLKNLFARRHAPGGGPVPVPERS